MSLEKEIELQTKNFSDRQENIICNLQNLFQMTREKVIHLLNKNEHHYIK